MSIRAPSDPQKHPSGRDGPQVQKLFDLLSEKDASIASLRQRIAELEANSIPFPLQLAAAENAVPNAGGYPDQSTTGVPAGTELTPYTGPTTIREPGTVVEGKMINEALAINAADVVIRRCVIRFANYWGIDAEHGPNITVEDCELTGSGYAGNSIGAILGSGQFFRNNISRTENGIVLTQGASVVRGNFIHDLESSSSDPHYDGISVQGNQDGVLIEGNTIIGRDTSDVFIKNDFGPVTNVIINDNLLLGTPGYCVYVEGRGPGGPVTNIRITNNRMKRGSYGYISISLTEPVLAGNVEHATGNPVGAT